MLATKYTISRNGQDPNAAGNHRKNLRLSLEAVADAVANTTDKIGATPAQVALAWTMSRSRLVHPILGASSAAQLLDNLGALALVCRRSWSRNSRMRRSSSSVVRAIHQGHQGLRVGYVYGDAGAKVDA